MPHEFKSPNPFYMQGCVLQADDATKTLVINVAGIKGLNGLPVQLVIDWDDDNDEIAPTITVAQCDDEPEVVGLQLSPTELFEYLRAPREQEITTLSKIKKDSD